MKSKFIGIAACFMVVLLVFQTAFSATGAEPVNWYQFIALGSSIETARGSVPYEELYKSIGKYTGTGGSSCTDSGITVSVKEVVGHRYDAWIVLEFESHNGVTFDADNYWFGYDYDELLSQPLEPGVVYDNFDSKYNKELMRHALPVVLPDKSPFRTYNDMYYTPESNLVSSGALENYSGQGLYLPYTESSTAHLPNNKMHLLVKLETRGATLDIFENLTGEKVELHIENLRGLWESGRKEYIDGVWDLEVTLDYPDHYKVHKTTKNIKVPAPSGKDDVTIHMNEFIVTPFGLYVDSTLSGRSIDRGGRGSIPEVLVTVNLKDGSQAVGRHVDQIRGDGLVSMEFGGKSGLFYRFGAPLDIGKGGANIKSVVIGGTEFVLE